MEGLTRRSRATLFGNWELDSDEDSLTDEELGTDPDPDVMTASDGALGDGSSNESTSNSGKPPSITHSTASLDSFDTAELLRLPAELLEFTNWAFGPPTLEVLAFGDFSHDGRFHVHNKLFCRHTWSTRYPGDDTSQQIDDKLILTFRPVRENDRELWDGIDRNTEFLKACPTDSILDD
ncbi:hypothetical protein B0J14DRAFT_707985 [Halenospora varia]|nr:hypothetical protein B0J14DRAFT_707985 [Halenospora varia]